MEKLAEAVTAPPNTIIVALFVAAIVLSGVLSTAYSR